MPRPECAEYRAADALAGDAGQHGADDGADQRAGNGEAKLTAAECVELRQHVGGAGDDGGIEAEEQAAQRAD